MPSTYPQRRDLRFPMRLPVAGTALLLAGLLVGAGIVCAAGWSPFGSAQAATTDTVTVTATVSPVISLTNGCASARTINVALGSIAYSGGCMIAYGSLNDPTQKITLVDADALAPFQGSIPDTASNCAPLGAGSDQAGVHIIGTLNNSAISASWATTCTTASTAGANTYFRSTPAAAVDACTSSATNSTNHQCTFEWAVSESGSDLSSATNYTGNALFTVVDI